MSLVESRQSFEFSNQDFETISNIAFDEFGLKLGENKKAMVYSRLVGRVRELKLHSFSQYCDILCTASGEQERLRLLSSLTTNVTRFFREPHHFDELVRHIRDLPDNHRPIRMWSAACSTGPEAYSMAISILEDCHTTDADRLRILATDVDPLVLEKAQAGTYTQQEADGLEPSILNRHFGQSGGTFTVNPQLRNLIRFNQLNLLKEWPMQRAFDVIFCRNVAIYFDADTQKQLWSRLVDQLAPGGLLCIGHSERLSGAASEVMTPRGNTSYQKS